MAWISHTDASNESNGTINSDVNVINYHLRLASGVCGLVLFSVALVILLFMLCVYKTYKTTLQRLIVYYILLSMWFASSAAVLIVGAFPGAERRWNCIVRQYLFLSSEMAWYTYLASITNFALILIPCIMRGRRMPPQMRKCVECICVLLAVAMGLTVASVEQVYNHAHGIMGCTSYSDSNRYLVKRRVAFMSIYLGMDLEVILVSLSLCVAFCFIRQRVRIKQTAVLLRNSICHVAINACIIGLDSLRVGYSIYKWRTLKSNAESNGFLETTGVVLWNVFFLLAVFVSIIFQAVLCIQTSTEKNTFCKGCCHVNVNSSSQHYTAIDGKDTPTSPASSRVSQPSYTNFDVPYTEGFSQASASIHGGECKQRPLIDYVNN